MRNRLLLFLFILFTLGFTGGVLVCRADLLSLKDSSLLVVLLTGSLFGLLLLPGLHLVSQRIVFASLKKLRHSIEAIPSQKPDFRLTGGGYYESRAIATSVNELSQRYHDRIRDLELDKIRLRTILEAMIEGVITVDTRQRIVFANASAGRMLDFQPSHAEGRPLYEITRFPKIHQAVEKGLNSAQPYREEIEWASGPVKHLMLHIAKFQRDDAAGAILVMNDTTDLRRLEQMRRDFVANVSHELKTPLAVIQTSSEALLEGAIDDPEVRIPFLRQISEQCERLHALILDLISLARIESSKEVFDFMSVSLYDAVADSVDRHLPRAEQKNIQMRIQNARQSDLQMWIDPEALEQILDNLIDNAVKYSNDNGTVSLSWKAEGDQAIIRISDNGSGIPAADLPRIFERFYRVDKARSRQLGGTGLGLSIVKHLTNLMGGKVTASSELGSGTTMQLQLPLAKSV
ncbi:PAS domain-containing protein [Telmatocola sphagniphila]|uniref:histidine kinase n=1 Tax=Telmatocola sphagniphila TaxID=1123043 RepID=A0A8E6B5K3_9BACT|nr:ATP-binding protein [Telmatocola sphagniphila]QVL32550.1 PAS domain-containing protein [Telmatocola sphagniphila]